LMRSVPIHYSMPSHGYSISNLARTVPSGAVA
jgi:hypothetical protein